MSNRLVLLAIFTSFITGAYAFQNCDPNANPRAIVPAGDARFTILSDRLIRLEWSQDRKFEDRASLTFINRKLPAPAFKAETKNSVLQIKTRCLTLSYKTGTGAFSKENLSIEMDTNGVHANWYPGLEDKGNLGGTARTLDGYKGSVNIWDNKEIRLDPGIISRDGWVVVDDSEKPLFDNSQWQWVMSRPAGNRQDWYFFGFGHDYKAAMAAYVSVAGNIPLLPRFALGTWWSHWWEYTDVQMRQLADEFALHDVPLEVLVIDMDWHITSLPFMYSDNKKGNYGWTGFSWDRNHFPDPNAFLKWTDRHNIKTCMNIHPADGVLFYEDQYPAMAKAMGIDPASKKTVEFDITNKKFASAYMDLLMHPMQKAGIDFWWLDWQQWGNTKIPGVNPTFYLNYVHFSDMQRQNKSRPIIFHRYGGLGNHRYPIGFSGDTIIDWSSLDFQPYFTATAANVGFGFWSHDIGGFMGTTDNNAELYTRWLQLGTFSPIFRVHSAKWPKVEKRIWAYPLDNFYAMREAYQLRYALIPYIYTMARQTNQTGLSLCRPMYYEYPEDGNAYAFKNEYMFGNDMIVNPVTHPMEKGKNFSTQKIWLPAGTWIEWFTGTVITGPQVVERTFAIDEVPVYVKAGAIIPMSPQMRNTEEKPVDPLILSIFPGPSGRCSIYEDAGNDQQYLCGDYATTDIRFCDSGSRIDIVIEPVKGGFDGMLKSRSYEIRLVNSFPPVQVRVNGKKYGYSDSASPCTWEYDGQDVTTRIHIPGTKRSRKIEISVVPSDSDTKALSGRKGQFKRLSDFVAHTDPADEPAYEFGLVAKTSQTGQMLSYHPEAADALIKDFDTAWNDSLNVIEKRIPLHSSWASSLKFLKSSGK